MVSFKHKLVLLLVAISFGSLALLSAFHVYATLQDNERDQQEYRRALYELFDIRIKSQVETAHSLVGDIYRQQQAGLLSEAAAKKQAADLVRNLRFDNDNYFWIDTVDGVNVVLLGRATEGKSRLEDVDPTGKKLIREIIQSGLKPGGGFSDYHFPKPNQTEAVGKRSYSLLFEPYGWVIGTGNWTDDIEKLLAAKAREKNEQLRQNIIASLAIGLLCLLLSSLTALALGRKTAAPVHEIVARVQEIAAGNFSNPVQVQSRDELANLADNINRMRLKLADSIEALTQSNEELLANNDEIKALYSQIAATEQDLELQVKELKQKEQALQRSEDRFEFAIEAAENAIFDLDLQTMRYIVPPNWGKNLNIPEVSKLADFAALVHPDDLAGRAGPVAANITPQQDSYAKEYRVRSLSGEYIWVLARGRVVRDDDGKPLRLIGALTNISDIKKREREIEHLAYHDHLTGLLNRRGFQKEAARLLETAANERHLIALLDFDDFKLINDVHGQTTGDEILRKFGQYLRGSLDATAVIARQGGDEFLICLPDSEMNAAGLLSALCLADQAIDTHSSSFILQLSGGMASYPEHGEMLDVLLRKADLALNQAKRAGKQQCLCYDDSMQEPVQRRHAIVDGLKRALPDQHLGLVFQPIYELSANGPKVHGFEALLRWNSPKLGLVSPAEFIPVAEESDLIVSIGAWVLREACLFAVDAEHPEQGVPTISVNVSVRQLLHDEFIATVRRTLQETGLPAAKLQLEITESLLMHDVKTGVERLHELRKLGVGISLDDFGTGFSSLTYLQQLPISVLKLDKGFVESLGTASEKNPQFMIHNLIQIAHHFGYHVVAEGVETQEQREALSADDCDYYQGYLFSMPLPRDEALAVARNR